MIIRIRMDCHHVASRPPVEVIAAADRPQSGLDPVLAAMLEYSMKVELEQ